MNTTRLLLVVAGGLAVSTASCNKDDSPTQPHSSTRFSIQSARNDGAPIVVPGYTDTLYSFTCHGGGKFPQHPRFEWNFGDGNRTTRTNDSTVKHSYIKRDTFTLSVAMFDNDSTGTPAIAVDTERVTIIPFPSEVQGTHDTTVAVGTYTMQVACHTAWKISGGDVRRTGTVGAMWVYIAPRTAVHVEVSVTAHVTPAAYTVDSTAVQYDVYTALQPYFGTEDTSFSISPTVSSPHTYSISGASITADFTLDTYDQSAWVGAGLVIPIRRDRYENLVHTRTDYYLVPISGVGSFLFEPL